MSVENYDIKTAQATISNAPVVDIIGVAVPDKMKRYITFLKYNNVNAAAQMITLHDAATATGTDTTLDKQTLAPGDTIMFPDSPDPEKPIMSLGEGRFLTGVTSVGASVDVTVGYYDE